MGKPAPKYWWKFNGPNHDVVVKSDHEGGECVARFEAPEGVEHRDVQIAQAEALIGDFVAGRKTPCWDRASSRRQR